MYIFLNILKEIAIVLLEKEKVIITGLVFIWTQRVSPIRLTGRQSEKNEERERVNKGLQSRNCVFGKLYA